MDINSDLCEDVKARVTPTPTIQLPVLNTEMTEEETAQHIESHLTCPNCPPKVPLGLVQGVSLAEQMRQIIRQQLAEGKSQEAIFQYFVERYGQIILYSEDSVLEINVTAYQWWWAFEWLTVEDERAA